MWGLFRFQWLQEPLRLFNLQWVLVLLQTAKVIHSCNQQANTMASIPAGKTWFECLKQSFVNVTIGSDQGIDTSTFLEAAESTTTLFGKSSLVSLPRLLR